MTIVLLMIPLSILLLIGAAVAFFWAVDHDQFDDLDTPGLLPLTDEPPGAASTRHASGDSAGSRRPKTPPESNQTGTSFDPAARRGRT